MRRYAVTTSACAQCGQMHSHPSAAPGELGASPGGQGCSWWLRHRLVVIPPRRPGLPPTVTLVPPPDEPPAPPPSVDPGTLADLHRQAAEGAKAKGDWA